ncbi:MAG: DUF4097 family beta strand repeat-containing protein, partial [Halobacteriales archaeon]|nr:DUF4097 family beta strand repeat-containing protein [Halobacteriales archaeon]
GPTMRRSTVSAVISVLVAGLAPMTADAQYQLLREMLPPGTSISIYGQSVTLSIAAGDRPSVEVWTTPDRGLTAESRSKAGRLEIEIRRRGPARPSGGIRDTVCVKVPREVALTTRSYWGAINVVGVEGRTHIETYHGPSMYRGPSRELTVTAFHGASDIQMTDPAQVLVTGGGGSVRIRASGGSVRAETVRGDIGVVSTEPLSVSDLSSTMGAIRFEAPLTPTSQVSLESHSGDVDLVLAPEMSARVSVQSYAGSIEVAGDLRPVPRSGAMTEDGLRRADYTLGLGEARVLAKTFRGDVRVIHGRR